MAQDLNYQDRYSIVPSRFVLVQRKVPTERSVTSPIILRWMERYAGIGVPGLADLLMSGGFPRFFFYVALAHSGTSPSLHLIDTDWGKGQLNGVSRPLLKVCPGGGCST